MLVTEWFLHYCDQVHFYELGYFPLIQSILDTQPGCGSQLSVPCFFYINILHVFTLHV